MARMAVGVGDRQRGGWMATQREGQGEGSRGMARHLEADPGDAELVVRLKGGDEEAFAGLLRRNQGKVYRLAMNLTRNAQDAEEVTQDVFLTVARKIGAFDGRAAFSTWLYRVATNAALMKLRRRRGEPHLSLDEEGALFSPDGTFARPVADW